MSFRVLDWYCCQGGAAMGYREAGATEIVGYDIEPQRRYPFRCHRGSALDQTVEYIRTFDFVHASPPCQFGTEMRHAPNAKGSTGHLNLIPQTRALLNAAGVPYVIENVRAVRPHLIDPVSLFGTMFGNHLVTAAGQRFVLSRERVFEANWDLQAPSDPGTQGHPIANVFGGHLRARGGEYRSGGKTGRTRDFIGEDKPALARQLMGMPWASMNGMSEAVPPSYTKYIGEQFLAWRVAQREAA